MKRDAIISIKGVQKTQDYADSVEFITEGTFDVKKDGYKITYEESEVTGLTGETTLLIEKAKVTMTRTGENSTHIIFEEGVRHLAHYDMGFGTFNVGVHTHCVGSTLKKTGGELKLRYSIEINNEYTGMNTFFIAVKGVPDDKSDTVS